MTVNQEMKTNNDNIKDNTGENINVTKQRSYSAKLQKKIKKCNHECGHIRPYEIIKCSKETLEYRRKLLEIIEDIKIDHDLKFILNHKNIIDTMYYLTLNITLPSYKRSFSNVSVYSISFKERIFLKTIIDFFFKYNIKEDNFFILLVEHIESDFEINLRKYSGKKSFITNIIDLLESIELSGYIRIDPYRTIDSAYKNVYQFFKKTGLFVKTRIIVSELINFLIMFLYTNPGFFIPVDIMQNVQNLWKAEEINQHIIGDLLQFCVNPDEFIIFKRMLKIIYRIVNGKETTVTIKEFVNGCYPVFDSSKVGIFNYFGVKKNLNPKYIRFKVVEDMLSYFDENIPKWML